RSLKTMFSRIVSCTWDWCTRCTLCTHRCREATRLQLLLRRSELVETLDGLLVGLRLLGAGLLRPPLLLLEQQHRHGDVARHHQILRHRLVTRERGFEVHRRAPGHRDFEDGLALLLHPVAPL